MRTPILGKLIDERFLTYRLRSSSVAGIVGAIIAIGLFEYKFFAQHVWSWDLLAVVVAMVVVKLSMMAWFLIRN
jgi:phosphate/sulfate permease